MIVLTAYSPKTFMRGHWTPNHDYYEPPENPVKGRGVVYIPVHAKDVNRKLDIFKIQKKLGMGLDMNQVMHLHAHESKAILSKGRSILPKGKFSHTNDERKEMRLAIDKFFNPAKYKTKRGCSWKVYENYTEAWVDIQKHYSKDSRFAPYHCSCGAVHIGHSKR